MILTQWAINIYEICYNQATRCFQTMRGKQLSLHFDIIQCNQDNGMHNTHEHTLAHTYVKQSWLTLCPYEKEIMQGYM